MRNGKSLMLALALAPAAVVSGGCFDVEQSVSLQRDLSGHASFYMTMSLEAAITAAAGLKRRMSGKSGVPTLAEIDAVRREVVEGRRSEVSPAEQREEVAKRIARLKENLPRGVRLASSSFDDQGTTLVARLDFEFDDVRKLAYVKVPETVNRRMQPARNPYADPFAGLTVVDEGPTLLVTMSGADPAARMQQWKQDDPAVAGAKPEQVQMMEGMLKSARLAFKLESPFEVVDANATRRDGRTLYWELKASDPDAKERVLSARLKK
jgi:hypothetical protein